MYLVLTTLDDKSKLAEMGMRVLEERLAACYNLLPIESAYWWEGRIESGAEYLMILKAPKSNLEQIEALIREISPYDTPEVMALEADKVDPRYEAWLAAETRDESPG